jgi:hypothetical protein
VNADGFPAVARPVIANASSAARAKLWPSAPMRAAFQIVDRLFGYDPTSVSREKKLAR